jgi:hypothetical protein
MGKAKAATRKKGSKRLKASAKVKRKSVVRRATAKKVKLKVRRAGGVARKSKVAANKASRKTLKQVEGAPIKDTIIDVIEEPAGVVAVTEVHTIATANSTPSAVWAR